MKHGRHRIIPHGLDRTIAALVVVGLLSFLPLIYSHLLWRNNFRRNIPMLDNLMQARVSMAEGHIWIEELLLGNEAAQIEMIRDIYEQAAQSVDACLQGKSAIGGLPGLPLTDNGLAEQFDRLKWSIERSESIAEERWRHQGKEGVKSSLRQQHHAAYHGGGLLASAINFQLQRDISKSMKTQSKVFALTLALWGIVLACLCAAFSIAGRRQKKAESALWDSESRLHLLSSHLLTAQERERSRISLELHDELGQSLTVLKLQIRSIAKKLPPEQKTPKEDCLNSLHYVDKIIESVRRLSRDLSPHILKDLGLTAAIRWLTADFSKPSGINISLDMPDIDGLFGREAEIIIYRIIQEALNNIGKHSRAKHVSISVETFPDELSFVVHDDGRGFDLEQVKSENAKERGLGLTAMHERAKMLGGMFEISSLKDKGTRITFTAPLERKE